MRSLAELHKNMQQFQTVSELELIFEEIFESNEATNAEKRLREGTHARLFKLAGEELYPLISWMKLFAPEAKGRIIDGNQNFDAEVMQKLSEAPIRLEIGYASGGYEDRLLNEAITEFGSGSPNSTYKRTGKGDQKGVDVISSRITSTAMSTAAKYVRQIQSVAGKKHKKNYHAETVLVLFLQSEMGIRGESESFLFDKIDMQLRTTAWTTERVDVISGEPSVIGQRLDAVSSKKHCKGISMTTPKIAQKAPYPVEVEAGKTYFWCACGHSANQPFCDGSHKDTGMNPQKYTAEESKKVFFCGCKATGNSPLCDGSHSKL